MRSLAVFALLILGVASTPLGSLVNLRRDGNCKSYAFTSGNGATDNATWVDSGASALLSKLLQYDPVDWSDRFFEQTVAGGDQNGSTFDCSTFPDDSACTGPGPTPYTAYTLNEAFFIHQSMSNLYGAFTDMYSHLTTQAIIDVGAFATQLTNMYGPPPKDNALSLLLPLLIGVAVFGTIPAEISAFSATLVGVLNVAAGIANTIPASDPESFKGDLQDAVTTAFNTLSTGLEQTVTGLFSGNMTIMQAPGFLDTLIVLAVREGRCSGLLACAILEGRSIASCTNNDDRFEVPTMKKLRMNSIDSIRQATKVETD